MKILLIERTLHNVYFGFYKTLSENFEVEILTYNQSKVKDLATKLNIRIRILPSNYIINYDWGFYFKNFYSFLKNERYDLIHCRVYFSLTSLILIFYSIFNKKKILFSEEQQDLPNSFFIKYFVFFYIYILKFLFNIFDIKIVCITKLSYNFLNKFGFQNISFLPLPFAIEGLKENKQISTSKKLKIIVVARFEWLKNHQLLIEAINYIIKNRKLKKTDLEITLVGVGDLQESIISLINKYDLTSIFKIIDSIKHKDLINYYSKFNLLILPSRIEMVGAVVIEAMNAKLPVIVSDKVGSSYLVKQNFNGFIFKNECYKDLAKYILKLKDPKIRIKFGVNSFFILNNMKSVYSNKNIENKLINFIKDF